MARFIALPKLPSAKETVEVMMNHVFRVHGFPKDIVSDWGPQFVFRYLDYVPGTVQSKHYFRLLINVVLPNKSLTGLK